MKTLLFCTILTTGSFANDTMANDAMDTTSCSQGDTSRTVSIVYSVPGQPVPCEVLYEKPDEGQSMTLWRAGHEVNFCETRAAGFVAKLIDLGWSCMEEEKEIAAPSNTTTVED